jgi:hypothetical protein
MIPANLFAANPVPAPGAVGPVRSVFTGTHNSMPGAPVTISIPSVSANPMFGWPVATDASLTVVLAHATFVLPTPMAWAQQGSNNGTPSHGTGTWPTPPPPPAAPLVDVGFGGPAGTDQTFNILNPNGVVGGLSAIPSREMPISWEDGDGYAGTGVMIVGAGGTAFLELDAPTQALVGDLVIELPFHVRFNDARAFMTVYQGNIVRAAGPLTTAGGDTDITITYGDVVDFQYDARLNRFTVRETGQPGTLVPMTGAQTANLVFRLISPAHYTWDDSDLAVVAHNFSADVTNLNSDTFWLSGNRDELIIGVTVTRATGPHGRVPIELRIEGLVLQADDRAPLTGNLNVPFTVGTFNGSFLFEQNENTAGTAEIAGVNIDGTGWARLADTDNHTTTLLVARRVLRGLNITTVEAEDDDLELPALRSGYLIGSGAAFRPDFTTSEDWVATGDYDALLANHTTGRTAILRMEEVVPNSFDVARNRPIVFTLPEGVIITGIEWRYVEYDDDIDDEDWEQAARPIPTASQTVGDVQFLNNRQVQIRPNLQAHTTGGYRTNVITIDARFYVSIEAGFAARVTDELTVAVTGAGVGVLPNGATEVVAEIFDPVTIEHFGGAVHVHPVVGRENNIYHTPAGRLEITETAGGMLQEGTILLVGIVRQYGIGSPLALSRGHVVPSADSDLSLLVVERIDAPAIGSQATTWFELEVIQASEEDGEPGTIVIDGLTLFGHVYQGEVYYLIVSGPAIAENHLNWGWVSNQWPNPEVGIFVSPPYFMEIVEFVAREGEGAPDRRANSLAGVSFDGDRDAFGTPEVVFARLPGMAQAGGFIQARLFATTVGVDPSDIHWDGTTGTATISGWDYQGNWVTVILVRDSTTAQILRDGQATLIVDIAEFAPGTAPIGTLAPVFRYGRIYLPARFLFNVFGYSADYRFSRPAGTNRIVVTPM